jgi:hypothetical protein
MTAGSILWKELLHRDPWPPKPEVDLEWAREKVKQQTQGPYSTVLEVDGKAL